jgi:prophage regulatory protein
MESTTDSEQFYGDRIIRKPELLKILGVSHPTVWRWEKAGLFPKRIPLGPNSSGWIESEVYTWLKKKADER